MMNKSLQVQVFLYIMNVLKYFNTCAAYFLAQ